MMSEHQKHTEFLRQCLLYDDSSERHLLDKGITQILRDARCVGRAVWLMAMLTALAAAGLFYEAVLVDNFPDNKPQLILNIICALGLGALICLVVFAGLGMIYRRKLNRRREECRQLVTKLLESRLGKPATMPSKAMQDNFAGNEDGRTVRVIDEVNDSPAKVESAAHG